MSRTDIVSIMCDQVWLGGIERDGLDKKQEVKVVNVKDHPGYNTFSMNNDITVLTGISNTINQYYI